MDQKRDIDHIIELIKEKMPDVRVDQLQKTYPADDDGLWWFSVPDYEREVQIENSNGRCPFLIETWEPGVRLGSTVDETVAIVVAHLQSLRDMNP